MAALRQHASFLAVGLLVSWRLTVAVAWSESRGPDPPPSHAPVTQSATDVVHRAVGILNYVIGDYPIAVGPEGEIRNEAEYHEQIALLEQVQHLLTPAQGLASASSPSAAVVDDLRELRQWVREQRRPEAVLELASKLRDTLVTSNGLVLAPAALPSLARGRRLYSNACAVCHGSVGRARTPTADRLDPRPTDLLSRHLDQTLSPYQAFNVVTYGVSGTSMPAFEALSATERWDIAFYVMAMRQRALPRGGTTATDPPLEAQATSSDAELGRWLLARGVTRDQLASEVARLRRNPSIGSRTASRDSTL